MSYNVLLLTKHIKVLQNLFQDLNLLTCSRRKGSENIPSNLNPTIVSADLPNLGPLSLSVVSLCVILNSGRLIESLNYVNFSVSRKVINFIL